MNGAFLLARQALESELWRRKPASWWKIWCYIIGNVQHKQYHELKRGQGYFNFTELCKTEAIGKDITINNVEKFIKYAKQAEMIAAQKATHGVLITVAKYDKYQSIRTYESGDKSGELGGIEAESERNESGDINKNDKNDKNVKNERYDSRNYLLNIPTDDLNEFTTSFQCSSSQVVSKGQSLYDWCLANGQKKKDNKAFLRNALRKDFTPRIIATNGLDVIKEKQRVYENELREFARGNEVKK